jgi:excinuclease ABC subunit C
MIFDSENFLKNLPASPGVYQMLDLQGKTLYVGKAKQLKNRVKSYFRADLDSAKTQLLVAKIADIKITCTNTENEALLLEQNLIKALKPRYNILLRDDKSYPYLVLSEHADFPRLYSYRGSKKKGSRYFGPYPNSWAVRDTLEILQKLFGIRSCTDSFFKNRTRPCLQYQIKRCTAPCVNLINADTYQENLQKAILFLQGKSNALINTLNEQMSKAAQELQYERAGMIRDQIIKLKEIQEQQYIVGSQGDYDVIALTQRLGYYCLVQQNVRDGKILGHKTFFQKIALDEIPADIIHAFIAQYYLNEDAVIPHTLLVNLIPNEVNWLSAVLTQQAHHKITITKPEKGEKLRWIELALNNAEQVLLTELQTKLTQKDKILALSAALRLTAVPQRIECFDISHQQGEATVASCVVFNEAGAVKSEYRKFNITDITPGDDYAAMHQAILRRYTRRKAEDAPLPDLLIIDGGRGQLQQAVTVLEALALMPMDIISISKGPGRDPHFDTVWRVNQDIPLGLTHDSIALHLIQQIRDEAHRFALVGHRQQSNKKKVSSILEQIEGVGAKRRRDLLKYFGGLQKLQTASLKEIQEVSGINAVLAQRIYETLHA